MEIPDGLGGMRPYQVFPKRRMIPHPYCDLCDADMWLTCIEPDKPHHDRRTFECPRCQHVKVEIVNYNEQNNKYSQATLFLTARYPWPTRLAGPRLRLGPLP